MFEAPCVPSDTLPVGEVIASAPAVSVKVAGVIAPAGRAVTAASVPTVLARRKNLSMSMIPYLWPRARPRTASSEAGEAAVLASSAPDGTCGDPRSRAASVCGHVTKDDPGSRDTLPSTRDCDRPSKPASELSLTVSSNDRRGCSTANVLSRESVDLEQRLAKLLGADPAEVRTYLCEVIEERLWGRSPKERKTGFRFVRGTHGGAFVRDPDGNDTPPVGYQVPGANRRES